MKKIITVIALIAYLSLPASEAWNVLRRNALKLEIGSGSLVVAPSGKVYILTNWHVCYYSDSRDKLHALLNNTQSYLGVIKKTAANEDLCAAEVKAGVKDAIHIAPEMSPFTKLYTRGYPRGMLGEFVGYIIGMVTWTDIFKPVAENCPDGTKPISSDSTGRIGCLAKHPNLITTLYVQPGSSGSPVVNELGELVGVVQSYQGDGNGGVVPLSAVQEFMSDL